MDKIQSALAKARAEREALKSASPEVEQAPAVARETAELASVTSRITPPPALDAWSAMDSLTVEPKLIEQNRIVALQDGAPGAEFDMMRTRVLQQMRANNWRRLAITSPTPACGKTTVALNLALSLSRQPDVRTILLEMDLRRPSLARVLGTTSGHKFARVLDGSEPFADHALRYGDNLILATNRSPSQRPAELLQGSKATEALNEIEATYAPDVIIFDMPPMLVSDDTIAFMNKVDCVLLVAAAETTKVKEVDICERELSQHTNMMGVVLNKCRHMGPTYGYGYYS